MLIKKSRDEIMTFNIKPVDSLDGLKGNCVIITDKHDVFKKIDFNYIKNMMSDPPVLIDVRGGFRQAANESFIYRSL